MQAPVAAIASTQGRMASLNFTGISEAFDLRLQISLTLGVVVSSPVWLYEAWAFLVPGLSRKERRYAIAFVMSAFPLFLAGCAAGWLVLPNMVHVLTAFAPHDTSTIVSARGYYTFILKLVLAIGVAFVMPIFLVLLNVAGILSGRAILKSWRVAIVATLTFAAIATPAADLASMFLLAIPIVALFYAAALFAGLNDRRRAKAAEKRERELVFS
jgi:sec-independent protein translocase protein TatC